MKNQIALPIMESDNFKQTMQKLLEKESSVDEAYAAYAKLVEETHNLGRAEPATHEIVWGERSSRGNRIENILLSLARTFSKTPNSPIHSFHFKSLHTLGAQEIQVLRAEMARSVELENICSLSAGVSMWMLVLSLAMIPLVGTTGIVLSVVSVLMFIGAVYGISKAHYRFLPDEFRDISADYWCIREITDKNI